MLIGMTPQPNLDQSEQLSPNAQGDEQLSVVATPIDHRRLNVQIDYFLSKVQSISK
jgi:hypothetical protein